MSGQFQNNLDESFQEEKKIAILNGQVFAGINLTLCALGLLANFAIILIILLLKDYKKSATHWYVLQLAIADTTFLLTVPFKVSSNLYQKWIYSNGFCKIVEAIVFINYYASVFFLMIMSIDRYMAVCHSLSSVHNSLKKEKAYYLITGCVWIIAIFLAIPIMLYTDVGGISPHCHCLTDFPRDTSNEFQGCLEQAGDDPELIAECTENRDKKCLENDFSLNETELHDPNGTAYANLINSGSYEDYNEDNTYNYTDLMFGSDENFGSEGFVYDTSCHYFSHAIGWKLYIWLNFSLFFLLPIVIMTTCYGLIIYRLSKMPVQSSRTEKDRWRITLMCIILVSVFTCCWVFFHSLHIAKIYGIPLSGRTCRTLSAVSISLVYLSSVLNPYLYSFLGTGCQKKLESLKSVKTVQQVMALKTRTSTFMTTNFRSPSNISDAENLNASREILSVTNTVQTKFATRQEKVL